MTYDDNAKALAIKAIGTVESDMAYTSINYNDPITIGFMQWYGARAAALLNRIRTQNGGSWSGVPSSLTDALDTRPATQSSYWNNRYLSRAEGEPLRSVLNNNKPIQNAQAIEDLEDYVVAAESAGIDKDNNTAALLFFFVMYHQSPVRALRVIANAGPSSSIDRLYSVCMNEPVLSQYRTRYTTARDIIKSGDVSGIEIDPGELGDGHVGGDTGGAGMERLRGSIRYVSSVGDALHIHFADGKTLATYPNGRGQWIASQDSTVGADVPEAGDVPDTPPEPPTGGVSAVRAALREFMVSRVNRYAYSQGPTRLEPEKNMYTDCSGLVRFAYLKVMGIDIGSYTGAQYNKGTRVASGPGSTPFPESIMEVGDLIYYNLPGGRAGYVVDHVEMYIGNGQVIGHGGPGSGPTIKNLQTAFSSRENWFIQRHAN